LANPATSADAASASGYLASQLDDVHLMTSVGRLSRPAEVCLGAEGRR